MDTTLLAAAQLIGAPNAQFLVLLLIGGLIGWSVMKIAHLGSIGALLLAGVTGAWLAAEFAVRAGVGQRCADAVLIVGAIGAALFCLAWRRWRYFERPGPDIAVHR